MCKVANHDYVVDNISFIAKRVSLGDTIRAVFDTEEKAFYFEDFIAVSGNTTIRVYFSDEKEIAETRNDIENLGCESEAFLARTLIAVNVPRDVDYLPLKKYLDHGKQQGKWSYEESCLAHKI